MDCRGAALLDCSQNQPRAAPVTARRERQRIRRRGEVMDEWWASQPSRLHANHLGGLDISGGRGKLPLAKLHTITSFPNAFWSDRARPGGDTMVMPSKSSDGAPRCSRRIASLG